MANNNNNNKMYECNQQRQLTCFESEICRAKEKEKIFFRFSSIANTNVDANDIFMHSICVRYALARAKQT